MRAAGRALDLLLHRLLEVERRIAEVVPAIEACDGESRRGPEPAPGKHPVKLVEVQVHHEEAIAERVGHGREAPMPHPTLVDAAIHAVLRRSCGLACTVAAAISPTTRSALAMPSSWKPLLQ